MIRFDRPCRVASVTLEYFPERMNLGDYLAERG